MNKIDEIKSCCKDCKDRKYKCHSDCEKYKKFKLILEREKKAQLIEKHMNNSFYEMRHGRRDKMLVRSKKFKGYSNFNK